MVFICCLTVIGSFTFSLVPMIMSFHQHEFDSRITHNTNVLCLPLVFTISNQYDATWLNTTSAVWGMIAITNIFFGFMCTYLSSSKSLSSTLSASILESFQDVGSKTKTERKSQGREEQCFKHLSSVVAINGLVSVYLLVLNMLISSGVTLSQMMEMMTMVMMIPLSSGLDAWSLMLEVYLAQRKQERRRILLMRLKKRIMLHKS